MDPIKSLADIDCKVETGLTTAFKGDSNKAVVAKDAGIIAIGIVIGAAAVYFLAK